MKKVITDNRIHQVINIDVVDSTTPIYIVCDGKFIGMIMEVTEGGWRGSAPIEWLTDTTFDTRRELMREYPNYDYFVMDNEVK